MIFRVILAFFLLSFFFIASAEEIKFEQSEYFLKNKAEIKFFTSNNGEITREVFVKGFRINDLFLANLSNNKKIQEKVQTGIQAKRIRESVVAGLGIPTGILLLYASSVSKNSIINGVYIDNKINNNFYDSGSFIFGLSSSIVFLYGIVNAFQLFNDFSGFSFQQVLTDKEAEDIVKKYNYDLKLKILNQEKINIFPNNRLSIFDNNIMILNITKKF